MTRRLVDKHGELLETAWQDQVLGLADLGGWATFHPGHGGHGSRHDGTHRPTLMQTKTGKGFPDLILVRGPDLLIRELKTDKGRLSPEQRVWIGRLEAAGVDVAIWRPKDINEVRERLLRRRPRPTAMGAPTT